MFEVISLMERQMNLTVLVGKLKGDPQVQKELKVIKGVEQPVETGLMRLAVKRYDRVKRVNVVDTFAVIVKGELISRMVEHFAKDDEVVVVAETIPSETSVVYVAKKIMRAGHEGLNLHVLVGAVEGVEEKETTTGKQMARISIRIPTENFSGEMYNNFIRGTAWGKTGEIAAKYLTPGEKSKWAILIGNSVNKKSGDTYYFNNNVEELQFMDTTTDKFEAKSKAEEGVDYSKVSVADYSSLAPEDDEIPF